MDVLFWSELLVVQVSIPIERPASTQKVRPMIGRPADVQIWSFNGSSKIGIPDGQPQDISKSVTRKRKEIGRPWDVRNLQ
jgi:hypothetical protein